MAEKGKEDICANGAHARRSPLGVGVRVLRLARRLTQAELAELAGVSRKSVYSLELGGVARKATLGRWENWLCPGSPVRIAVECPPKNRALFETSPGKVVLRQPV